MQSLFTQTNDVVIVGGGPVGCVLALALQQNGIKFTLLEARATAASHADTRALALSYGSRMILEKLGVWEAINSKATTIKTIHISQRGGLGRTKLNASDHQLPALGYVLPYGALTKALDSVIEPSYVNFSAVVSNIKPNRQASEVTFMHQNNVNTLASPLVIIADGGRLGKIDGLDKTIKEYGHDALVTKVKTELPHNNIAYERFTPSGPMALLPNGAAGFSLVWTGEKASIDALLALDDEPFLTQLQTAFGERVGQFLSVEARISFPLKLSTLKPASVSQLADHHLAIIGNAAQTMHPVAGQGFNVGLRDAQTLADLIIKTPQAELGNAAMLLDYIKARTRDKRGGLLFTDLLVNVFGNDIAGLRAVRGAGLGALELITPLKSMLVGKMSFGK